MAVDPLTADIKRDLRRVWEASGLSKSELARRLGCHETEARRILDPGTMTKLPRLEQVAEVLGYRLVVSFHTADPAPSGGGPAPS